jgi:hypothetical protein
MTKNIGYGVAAIIGIIALLIGIYGGYLFHPDAQTIEKIVTKEVPVQVEKIVEKVIPCETIPCEPTTISLDAKATYLDIAIETFIDEELEDLTECEDTEYDEDQIAVKKVYNDWSVIFSEDDTQVDFSIKLKYLDKDVEEKCYQICDVSVLTEEGEDPEIEFECE